MWDVRLPSRAEKEFRDLTENVHESVRDKLAALAGDPYPPGCRKLKGKVESWRIRVGRFSVIYEVDASRHVIVVLSIGNRKEVYRRIG